MIVYVFFVVDTHAFKKSRLVLISIVNKQITTILPKTSESFSV